MSRCRPNRCTLRAVRLQHLRDQQSELSVAQHGDALALGDLDLIQNFARRRDGFDEDGVFGGNRIGHAMQIADRQREEFAKRARVFDDAEHGASGAVAAEAARAPVAMAAGEVDFAGDALPNPLASSPDLPPLRRRIRGRACRRSRSIRAAVPDRWNRFRRRAGGCARSPRGRGAAAGGALRRGRIQDERQACCLQLRDMSSSVQAELVCFNASCRARFAITEVLYNCPKCGGLIEAVYSGTAARSRRAARTCSASAA